MICRNLIYDGKIVNNCKFRRDSQLMYVVGLLYGEAAMNCMFLLCSYKCKIEQPDTIQHNGMTNSENRNVH